jgi:hypothetical protein
VRVRRGQATLGYTIRLFECDYTAPGFQPLSETPQIDRLLVMVSSSE